MFEYHLIGLKYFFNK